MALVMLGWLAVWWMMMNVLVAFGDGDSYSDGTIVQSNGSGGW